MTEPDGGAAARGRVLSIEGASGVGKTATARALARTLPATRIAEAFDRLEPAPSLDIPDPATLVDLERTLLLEESRRYREAQRLRAAGRDVVVDTGFLDPVRYTAGLARLEARWRPALRAVVGEARRLIRAGRLGLPDRSIYLDLGDRAVAERVRADPAGHPPLWAARHARVAAEERRFWLDRVGPLSPRRLLVVRADRPAPTIASDLKRRLDSLGPIAPAGRSEALRMVGLLAPRPRARTRPARGAPGRSGRRSARARRRPPRRAGKPYQRTPASPSPP